MANKGKNMKVEFTYNKKADKTVIYIWKGMQLVDVRDLDGIVENKVQKKMTEDIKAETRWSE